MNNAVIYGATATGQNIYRNVAQNFNIQYFVDGDSEIQGSKVFGLEVKSPDEIFTTGVDIVIMGIMTGWQDVVAELVSKGFEEEKIICKYVDLSSRARIDFLEKVALIINEKNIQGAVAELGVYRGQFAKEINRVFSERKLYLYDTFEGFPAADLLFEVENKLLLNDAGKLTNTSAEYVLSQMPYKDKCVIRKGYFPETAVDDEKEVFAFVNIDVDLYKPLLAGLEFFWPRMVKHGYILVHDYFSFAYAGARRAVEEFAENHQVLFIPIGDTASVALVKN